MRLAAAWGAVIPSLWCCLPIRPFSGLVRSDLLASAGRLNATGASPGCSEAARLYSTNGDVTALFAKTSHAVSLSTPAFSASTMASVSA